MGGSGCVMGMHSFRGGSWRHGAAPYWAAAIGVLLLVHALIGAAAAQQWDPREPGGLPVEDSREAPEFRLPPYRVTPLRQTIALSAPPDSPVQAPRSFHIRRMRAPLQEQVFYSVESDLRSDGGRTLPRQWVQIKGVSGQWGTSDVLVLDAGQREADFWVRVLPEAWYDGPAWRYAGTYRGYLVPNVEGAAAVEVEVRIDRLALVELSAREFTIVAHSGVGLYESSDSVVVTVRANHSAWSLSRAFKAPRRQGPGESDRIPLSQVRISENGGPFARVPETPHVWLSGAELGDPRLVVRELRLQVEVTWDELAGRYEGTMELTLDTSGAL